MRRWRACAGTPATSLFQTIGTAVKQPFSSSSNGFIKMYGRRIYAILTPTAPPPHGDFAGDGSRMSRCEAGLPARDRIPHSEDNPMPTWLIATCMFFVALAAAYLLYAILNPEKF